MSEPLFFDTSIAIARVIHSREMKQRIADRIATHPTSAISLVVQQEFKRRLLKEAQYLLNHFNDKKSYGKVQRHVSTTLGSSPGHARKRNICLDLLSSIYELDEVKDDAELTERGISYLRSLLVSGIEDLRASVDYVVWESGCACSYYDVVEKVRYKRYEFESDRCSKTSRECGISNFLRMNEPQLHQILNKIKSVSTSIKTNELRLAEEFIENILKNFGAARTFDPCLTVGDLIIALESLDYPVFYTLNRKESLHLCRALNQQLIVRPHNPDKDDEIYLRTDLIWPDA